MRCLLHADGGPGIGLGHASRCGALAAALLRQGHATRVLVAPSSRLGEYLRRLGVPVVETAGGRESMLREARAFGAHVLVIDSYRWTPDDFMALRRAHQPVVAFDDEARRALPVDAVVNGAPAAAQLAYDVLPHTRAWLGPAYQVVRDDFRDVPARTPARAVERVIVLVGGDDPLRLLQPLAERLDVWSDAVRPRFRSELICGPYAATPETAGLTHVDVVRHPPDLRGRMTSADLALSAGGQTLYELARCGTPTIAFRTGADQANNLAALAAAGVVLDTGAPDDVQWLERVEAAVRTLAGDAAARDEMSRRAQHLVDGRGADRLAQAIARLIEHAGVGA